MPVLLDKGSGGGEHGGEVNTGWTCATGLWSPGPPLKKTFRHNLTVKAGG
jgi:hypothetical protein